MFYFLLLDMKFRLDGGGWGSYQDQRRETHGTPCWYLGMVDSTPLMVIFWMVFNWCCHIMLYCPSFPGLLLWVILALSLDLTDCKLPSILFGFQHSFEIDVGFCHPEKMNLSKLTWRRQILPAGFIATWDTQDMDCKLFVGSLRHPMFFWVQGGAP